MPDPLDEEVQKEAFGCFPFPQGDQCSSSSISYHTCRTYLWLVYYLLPQY